MPTLVPLTCEQCNRSFTRRLGQHLSDDGRPRRFCSQRCWGDSLKRPSNPTLFHLTCQACGKPFTRPKGQQQTKDGTPRKYCSIKCTHVGIKKSIPHYCSHCGVLFILRPSEVQRGEGQWCSRHCYNQSRTDIQTFTCEQCGVTFRHPSYTVRSREKSEGNPPRFCSHQCSLQSRRVVTDARACEVCNVSFLPRAAQVRRGAGRYCSNACRYTAHSAHMTAMHNGFAPPRGTEYGPNWYRQARLARERDNHACQHCGFHREGRRLPVHHVRHHDEFHGDWEAANVLSNLITLCERCHRAEERVQGRR